MGYQNTFLIQVLNYYQKKKKKRYKYFINKPSIELHNQMNWNFN